MTTSVERSKPRLPFDVLLCVSDHLHTDITTLSRLSRVDRALHLQLHKHVRRLKGLYLAALFLATRAIRKLSCTSREIQALLMPILHERGIVRKSARAAWQAGRAEATRTGTMARGFNDTWWSILGAEVERRRRVARGW